jgi:hypothetical protein
MYNFIFNFFYRYHKKGNSINPRFIATGAVAITMFFQLFLLANIYTYITGINLAGAPFSEDYHTNKLCLIPFGIIYLAPFVLFYSRKRTKAVLDKYPENYRFMTFTNIMLVLLVMLAPLFIGVQFLNHR